MRWFDTVAFIPRAVLPSCRQVTSVQVPDLSFRHRPALFQAPIAIASRRSARLLPGTYSSYPSSFSPPFCYLSLCLVLPFSYLSLCLVPAFVDFHVTPHSRCGFPVGQLCHYTLEANEAGGDEPPERLTLAFPTADVVLTGARLAKLIELLHDHSLGSVTPLDARYSNALGKAPWVARIVVSRIDKSGSAAG